MIIGSFVGFVDNNEAEIMDWGEEGGTGADDNERLMRRRASLGENVEPDLATLGHGLLRMDEDDLVTEGLREDFDELAGESDFRDEEDSGFVILERIRGEFEVNIGLAATSDAAEQTSSTRGANDLRESGGLSGIKGDFWLINMII